MLVRLDKSHRDLILGIRKHAEEYLSNKDTDQYQSGIDPVAVRRSFESQIDSGAFVGWSVDGEIVAIAAKIPPDAELWTPEEIAEPQTYITRVLVAEGKHGKQYGARLLDAIADEARQQGHKWLRLNCWTTNTRLHDYYRAQGFELVRIADVAGRMSGALFQRRL